jgi:Flp pilus assembly pilin Flp
MMDLLRGGWVRVSNALYREDGQAMTEYALVIALVALIGGAIALSGVGDTIIKKITDELSNVKP